MKKKLLILMFIVSIVACIFASCGECKHEAYEVKSTVAATCAADGKTISACTECGLEKVEIIPKTGNHTMSYEEIKPTCMAAGKNIGTCTVCGFVTETVGEPQLPTCDIANKKEIVISEPTCTTDGKKKNVCSICNKDIYVVGYDGTTPALKHTYERSGGLLTEEEMGISYVAGNCDTEGYVSRVCKDCGYDQDPITREEYSKIEGYDVEKYDSMKVKGHNWGEKVKTVAPTCDVNGYDLYVCQICNAEDKRAEVPAEGHKYNMADNAVVDLDYKIIVKPTCITEGSKAYICTVCQEVATDEAYIKPIPTVEHNVTNTNEDLLVVSVDANCTDDAYKIYKCGVDPLCEYTKTFTEEGTAIGHKLVVSLEPCCLTGGKTRYICENVCNGVACDYTVDDAPFEDIKHVQGERKAEPTCVKNAVYTCSACGVDYEAYTVAEGGAAADQAHGNHNFSQVAYVIEPTCSTVGYTVYSCVAGDCGLLDGDNLDANGEYVYEAPRDVKPRTAHNFNPLTEDGRIVCVTCSMQYRDISTEVTTDSDSLCVGCGLDECNCGLRVEWSGYISPKEPESISANVAFVKNKLEWTEVEMADDTLVMGEGIIALAGAAETKYTIKIYDAANGTLLNTIEMTGEHVVIDLYEYATVGQIEILATTDATVSFYSIIK
ncbi:MAG: hypothetical protein E7596_06185 [Ruminococcaceae bacterium]|nr:hypothetical protein [Oscillospiraceae bacterium]